MEQYSNTYRPNVDFVLNIPDVILRDTFQKNEIGDVILPFVVLRRMDCILEPYNKKVREQYKQFKDIFSQEKLFFLLRETAGGHCFYNTSTYTLSSLLDDEKNISVNFNNYMVGFNDEVQHLFECFHFGKVVSRLIRNNLLYKMICSMTELNFSLKEVDNNDMGYIFEELIRTTNEQINEQAGEHFTPRDVIRLMSAILFTPDADELKQIGIVRSIYDPACGTGGMLNIGKRYILEEICSHSERKPSIATFGQELNEQSYAIAKSAALVTGEDENNIRLGNSFTEDHFSLDCFDYIMANPPYGVSWGKDKNLILSESLNSEGRFYAGVPRTSDGQLLFIQHMLSKMKAEGSRVGVITTGSPLLSGNAGSGESNIRKWIIENDWLECIIALPKDIFYNTGIATYLWILTNKKSDQRRGMIQLINAVDFCKPCAKRIGNKLNDILNEHVQEILRLYLSFEENEYCKIFENIDFGQYELTIEQPLRGGNDDLILNHGKKQADISKRYTEKVSLNCDWKKYFQDEVLPHIDCESWVDITKTRKSYEINFAKYFNEHQAQEDSSTIVNRLAQSWDDIMGKIDSVTNMPCKPVDGSKLVYSGNHCIGNITTDWKTMKLKYCCSVTEGAHFSPSHTDSGKPFINISNVKNGNIDVSGANKISIDDFNKLAKQGCQPKVGDVLLAKDGSVRKTAIVSDNDFVVSSSLVILSPSEQLSSSYLKYMLDSKVFQDQMNEVAIGCVNKRITTSGIKEFVGVFPPKHEQNIISSFLDSKLNEMDSTIDEFEKIVEELKKLRASIITEAVTGNINLDE